MSHPCVTDVNQQFYAELESLGNQVELIVPQNFRHEYTSGPVQVTRWSTYRGNLLEKRVGFSSSIPLHFYTCSLRPFIRHFQPDVLYIEEEPYSASAWQAFYSSRGLSMKRVIYSAQNLMKKYPIPFRWSERYVLSHSDIAAVVSTEVQSVLKSKGFSGATFLLPLGVDTNQFRPSLRDRIDIRTLLGASGYFIVGFVGRLVSEKGIQNILDIIPRFQHARVRFLMLGNGPMLNKALQVQKRYPDILHVETGVPHRDIHRWMNAIDVLLLPSLTMPNWREQFGRVIVEAMACMVPVIGSNSGEIPRLLTQTKGGWVIPENNVDKIEEMIHYVRNNERERSAVALNGFKHVSNVYSKRALAMSFAERVVSS